MKTGFISGMAMAAVTLLASPAWAFQDPADVPAQMSPLAIRSPFMAAAMAGERIVAVGQRGHILVSDDRGKSWRQAHSPVSVDLVAVSFPTPAQGWSVGHGGIVLHTEDGGLNWTKQFDGKQAAHLAASYYEARGAADADAQRILRQAKGQLADGDPQPFLDVWFENEKSGFVVGTFNRIFRTEDGGKTWTPWMDRTDNPGELNFNAIRAAHGQCYIVGERGKVWRLDPGNGRFVAVPTPYSGTLFGALVAEHTVLVYGMRGSLYRTTDRGKNWEKLASHGVSGITGAAILSDGRILLAKQIGTLEESRDQGKTFTPKKAVDPMPYFSITHLADSTAVLTGLAGVRVETIE